MAQRPVDPGCSRRPWPWSPRRPSWPGSCCVPAAAASASHTRAPSPMARNSALRLGCGAGSGTGRAAWSAARRNDRRRSAGSRAWPGRAGRPRPARLGRGARRRPARRRRRRGPGPTPAHRAACCGTEYWPCSKVTIGVFGRHPPGQPEHDRVRLVGHPVQPDPFLGQHLDRRPAGHPMHPAVHLRHELLARRLQLGERAVLARRLVSVGTRSALADLHRRLHPALARPGRPARRSTPSPRSAGRTTPSPGSAPAPPRHARR